MITLILLQSKHHSATQWLAHYFSTLSLRWQLAVSLPIADESDRNTNLYVNTTGGLMVWGL